VHIDKSYALLRFLNRHHAIPSRAFFAISSWLLVLLISLNARLANRTAGILWGDDFKTGLRLLHWFARRGWTNLDIANDPYFDFSSCFKPQDIDALEVFLASRARLQNVFEDACDRLFLMAARAEDALERGDLANFARYKSEFEALERNLHNIAQPPTKKSTPTQKENIFSKENANAALRDFAALSRSIDLQWYVISGTFLGIVREGGWLAHDYDIDLGVNSRLVDPERLRNAITSSATMVLRKEDWQTRIVEREGEPKLERLLTLFKVVHRTGINIDVFIHHLEDGYRWHGSSIHRWNNLEFALKEYTLDGLVVLGPADSNKYLTENYGDWRTPVKDFNATTGTPNAVPVDNYRSRALFAKRRVALARDACFSSERSNENKTHAD
jgi:hypothetical protein